MYNFKKKFINAGILFIIGLIVSIIHVSGLNAQPVGGEALYSQIMQLANSSEGDIPFFGQLNSGIRKMDTSAGKDVEFDGNLRLLSSKNSKEISASQSVLLIRSVEGELYVLAMPEDLSMLKKGANSFYANVESMLANKMRYKIKTVDVPLDGKIYPAAMLTAAPVQNLLDKIFRIALVVVLFAVMVGMGMTLKPSDFKVVFQSPKGMIIGLMCQFIFLPLFGFGLGHALGYNVTSPFAFVGIMLVTATPCGATSNLFSFLAKGDVALAISLTATSTVLSLLLTPAIMMLFCSNIPEINMPYGILMSTIFVLVLLPLLAGMLVKYKWSNFAEKAAKVFGAIGLVAVIMCIAGGIAGNPEMFKHAAKQFGPMGFVAVFLLVFGAMAIGIIIPKLCGVNNYQTRTISIEVGIKNVILGMTIALLIQDRMGDFNSYMFAVSGLFALFMYIMGAIATQLYKVILPIKAA